MTELLTRPSSTSAASAPARERSGSIWWRGTLAAGWAVAVGVATLVVLVLVVWATDSRSGANAGEAVRAALQLWLAGHKVSLHTGHGTLAIAPLGLTLGLGFVVARAAAVLARGHRVRGPWQIAQVGAAVGIPYAVAAAFVAAAASGGPVRPSPVAALAAGLVLGTSAAAWGAARGTDQVGALADVLPASLRAPVGAGAVAVAVLLGLTVLLTLGSLTAHARTAADFADELGGGAVAMIALVVADALLLPNAAIAAIGYVTGPGFAVGSGTSVSLGGAHLAGIPSLPLLAAIPQGAAPTVVRLYAVVALLAAGAAAGWWVARRGPASLLEAAAQAVGAGAAAGVLAAVLVAVAGGSAGPGRMATVGASPWQVGLVLAGETAFVAALVAVPLTWRRRTEQTG